MTSPQTTSSCRAISLVGMMGTGKTTLGKIVAEHLSLPFIDSDHEIEKAQCRTIPEIFAQEGEKVFRDIEAKTIAQCLAQGQTCVLATGGGAVTSKATRELLSEKTQMFWLQSSPEQIFARIQQDPNRPLLQSPDPLQRLKDLLDQRKDFYAQAHHHILLNEDNPLETVNEVIDLIQG